ncbi:hypothetical protein EYF80_062866 [Liparis tanakae]|uniref:Uncharacterized protein n=1 Tax=Liparis tanakae TaxID=230148 RepID=A0A4Z2EE18_9TELE|nr:hypothetical protein EYF80_062866 [Liparis tanakae]
MNDVQREEVLQREPSVLREKNNGNRRRVEAPRCHGDALRAVAAVIKPIITEKREREVKMEERGRGLEGRGLSLWLYSVETVIISFTMKFCFILVEDVPQTCEHLTPSCLGS